MPFTPVQTLIGAAMMGMAANNLLVLNGGVLGVSGFAHRSVASLKHSIQKSLRGISGTASNKEENDPGPDPEQLALLSMAGLLAGGLIVGLAHSSLEKEIGAQLVDVYVSSTPDWRKALGYALGGALVGLGSKASAYPTHVVRELTGPTVGKRLYIWSYALWRISPFAAILGCCAPFSIETGPERELGMPSWWTIMLLQIPILFYRYGSAFLKGFAGEKAAKKMVAFSTSLHFSLGLVLSGMLRPSKILNFFNLTPSAIKSGEWDPSLLLVIVGGIIPQLLAWQCCLGAYILQPNSRPKFADTWSVPKVSLSSNWKESITPRLVFGAAIFGAGWGLCGICPGPAAIMIGVAAGGDWRVQVWRSAVWVPSFVVGGIVGGMI